MSKIIVVNEDDAMTVVKVLAQNGFTVKVYQTDDTLVETIIEFENRKEKGYNPYQE